MTCPHCKTLREQRDMMLKMAMDIITVAKIILEDAAPASDTAENTTSTPEPRP